MGVVDAQDSMVYHPAPPLHCLTKWAAKNRTPHQEKAGQYFRYPHLPHLLFVRWKKIFENFDTGASAVAWRKLRPHLPCCSTVVAAVSAVQEQWEK